MAVTSAKLGKIAGWLLIIGPVVDVLVNLLRPGNFPSEHADGPQATMQVAVRDLLDNTTLFHVLIDIEFLAAFGVLLGFWAVTRILGDTDGRGHLRKMGMLFFVVALALRSASTAMGFLLATVVGFTPSEALTGDALDTAVMFLVMEGALGVFATILILVGGAFFAGSLMNANLIGADRQLAVFMGIAPAIVGCFLLLLAPLVEGSVFGLYLAGNVVTLIQVLWMIMLGVAFLRKSDTLPAMS
jgi:hypothetical protein